VGSVEIRLVSTEKDEPENNKAMIHSNIY